jgi:hypothetical protein
VRVGRHDPQKTSLPAWFVPATHRREIAGHSPNNFN